MKREEFKQMFKELVEDGEIVITLIEEDTYFGLKVDLEIGVSNKDKYGSVDYETIHKEGITLDIK